MHVWVSAIPYRPGHQGERFFWERGGREASCSPTEAAALQSVNAAI